MRTVTSVLSVSHVISHHFLSRSPRRILGDVLPALWAAIVAVVLMRGSLSSLSDYLLAVSAVVMLVIMWARSTEARREHTRR